MTKTKRILSLVVSVMMLVQMFAFTNVFTASAAETSSQSEPAEKDYFALLSGKGYLAVAQDGDGTNDGASGMKVRANESGAGGQTLTLTQDISAIQIDADKNLIESDALTDVLSKLIAAGGISEERARKVITYAKINGRSNYVGASNDGGYFKTTKTDGVTEKAVWYPQPFYRYRASGSGGDATYEAQYTYSYGPYVYATDSKLNNETNLTFIVEYFDGPATTVSALYASTTKSGATQSINNLFTTTNTGKWKVATYSVTDANFSNSNLGKTGLVYNQDDFRFQAGAGAAISRFMVVKTSDFEECNNKAVYDTDFSAFEDYGIYSYAGNDTTADTESGMTILDYTNESYDNRLYNIHDDKAYLDETMPSDANLKGAYDKLVELNTSAGTESYQWLSRSVDGAWKYNPAQGKNAYWTRQYVRNRTEGWAKTPSGAMYFKLNNDVIDESDTNLTFIIEYFDAYSGNVNVSYCNTEFVNNGAKTSGFNITRTGSKVWKTQVFHVTDAKIDKDWNKTGLGNGSASIKIQGPGSDFYIGKMLIIPTDTYSNIINPPEEIEGMEVHNDGINWWELVKEKGVYVEASNPTANTGMTANTDDKLYDLNNAADVAQLGSTTIAGKTVDQIKAAGVYYVNKNNADKGANLSSAISGDGISKKTFFTARNFRNNTSNYDIPGYLYFKVTSDKITDQDTDLYVVIEYLDYDPNMGLNQNSNGTANYKNQSAFSPVFATLPTGCTGFPSWNRHNTNTWKTVAIPVTNANLTSTNVKTGLVDHYHDIRICGNRVATHISRVGIVKASDVGIGTHKYYAPEVSGSAPQIFLAGDSIVEQLDTVNAYPRATIGMQLGNYFKKKSISNASSYTYDENDYRVTTTTNEGVTIVNRAKGGKSTRSFLNQVDPTAGASATDTRWNDIKSLAKQGDYLFVSFCINDVSNRTTVQTNPYLVGDTGDRFSHRANIKEFKDACDELGVNLVLLTPIPGRGLGTGSDAHIASVHAQARELGLPVIDVNTYYKALVQSLKDANSSEYPIDKTKLLYNYIFDDDINPEYSTGLGKTDDTHVNYTGANEICKIIIQEIQRKATSYTSINELSKWVDTSKNITTMAAPAHQETELKYAVSGGNYIVDGQQKQDYQKGEVSYSATVTNVGSDTEDAFIYLALYDGQGDLEDVVVSAKTTLSAGASQTITTPSITVPDLDGYKLRKFIWNGEQTPYSEQANVIVLTADGASRRTYLEWKLSKNLDDVTFDIYRDNLLIASTSNGGYIDDGVERGEHSYQINVVKNGEVVYQSPIAVATVTNNFEVKEDPDVFYVKAGLNSMNQKAHMNGGLKIYETGATPTFPQDAVAAWNLTESDIEASYGTTGHKFQGNPLVVVGGDGSYRTERVKDKYGIEKTAFMSAAVYRPNNKGAVQAYLYVDETNTANFTADDSTITIFIEFLANKTAPEIQYSAFTKAEDGTVSYSNKSAKSTYFSGTTGSWRVARYDITDAYFSEDTSYADESMFRIVSGWGTPNYISSIVVVKGDIAKANQKFAELNNLEFSEYNVMNASEKYPDGVSIDFSSGTPVKDGMDIHYSTSGTGDNTAEVTTAADGVGYYGTKQVILDNGNLKNTFLYFSVDKDYLIGGNDKLVLDITYKADYNLGLVMNTPGYDRASGWVTTGNSGFSLGNLVKNTQNNWQTMQVVVDKTNFIHFDNNGAAFRLFVPQSKTDANQQLRISKIRVRNLDAIPVQVETAQADNTKTTIHIAADSIAATYTAERTAEDGIMGWGMVIGNYLKTDKIAINNQATPGASTKTFGNMPAILNAAKEGDYVLISFGHNDQMTGEERFTTVEEYKTNLTNFIAQIREKKAVPVLVTMIPQVKKSTGTLVESTSFDERRAAVAEVASQTGTMLVKLGEQMLADEDAGKFQADEWSAMYCTEKWDNTTHLAESGCHYVAQIIVEKLSEVSPFFGTFAK